MQENSVSYKDKMAHKAISIIRKLSKGNGVEKDSIQLIQNAYEDVTCEAITHIELTHEVDEKKHNGAVEGGQAVQDASQIPQLIEQAKSSALKNLDARKMLAQLLMKRPDQGFSIHGKYFDVPPLTKIYQYTQNCGSCNGAKAVTCQRCHGGGQEQCGQCGGRRSINCSKCSGNGSIQGQDGKPQTCNQCYGKRNISCPLCRAQGMTACRICKGQGGIKCDGCKGIGIFSYITTVTYKMKTLFEIDRSALPDFAIKMIENKGSQLAQQKHIQVKAEQVKREDGGLAIQYDIKFPYTNVALNMNGKPIKIALFGYKMKIMKVTNFLDQLVEKNYALLTRAANDDGNVISHIRKASKSKIIADGLLLAVTRRPKEAMMMLKKKYPYGATNQIIKDIILQANNALSNISRKGRYSGLLVGFVLYLALLSGYFIGPIRGIINNNDQSLIDFTLIPIGIAIIIILSKLFIKTPIKRALGALMPERQRASFKPRSHNNWPLIIGGTLLCFVAIAYIARFTGGTSPTWMPF